MNLTVRSIQVDFKQYKLKRYYINEIIGVGSLYIYIHTHTHEVNQKERAGTSKTAQGFVLWIIK